MSSRGFLLLTMLNLNRAALVALVPLLICTTGIYAAPGDGQQNRSALMIPQTVYVGDRGMLIVTLPDFPIYEDIISDPSMLDLLSTTELELHRITLEGRPNGSRLVVEFSGYAPGVLELPPIEIGDTLFSGIKVEITSIISKGEEFILSDSLPPLLMPGTSLLVYGSMSAGIVLLLFVLWLLLWGRDRLSFWISALKQKWLIVIMLRIEKRLAKAMQKGSDARNILDTLSYEFRSFLGYFVGIQCRSMTSSEFGRLSLPQVFASLPPEMGNVFLERFFTRCDYLRFGGVKIAKADALPLFDGINSFLRLLDKAIWNNALRQGASA